MKELVENAIDAKSERITIELENAGKKLIRVTDDGTGIPSDELKLAFEKHSTSKISKIEDIYTLSTLGFRGEALASIAAVARVECISSIGKNGPGRKLALEGGVVRSDSIIGCPKGTTIKVKDLFFNLPARLKYLKSDQTELAHIIDEVTHIAIFHYQISFKLIHNSRELLNFPATRNQLNNLVNIYGKELVRELIPIDLSEAELNPYPLAGLESSTQVVHSNVEETRVGNVKDNGHNTIKSVGSDKSEIDDKSDSKAFESNTTKLFVHGFISKPSTTRSDRGFQTIYVNGRYIDSKVINDAIKEAYRSLVMKHRYPVVILFLQLNPAFVDINISPTKILVRFMNEKRVFNYIYRFIQNTLNKHDLIPEVKVPQSPKNVTLKAITTLGIGKPGYLPPINANEEKPLAIRAPSEFTDGFQQQAQASLRPEFITKIDEIEKPGISTTLRQINPIGQVMDTYIIAQSGEHMLIIDQHAASERIMYEKIKSKYSTKTMFTQELLTPVELELAPKELALLKTSLRTLSSLNFSIDELGENKFYVKSIPIILGRLQEPGIIHDLITDLISTTDEKQKQPEQIKDEMIRIMACKAAIKAGKTMNIPEINLLLKDLYSIKNPYTCAHGRPTIISMSDTQLRKLFKRII